jgi:hypothetical protein
MLYSARSTFARWRANTFSSSGCRGFSPARGLYVRVSFGSMSGVDMHPPEVTIVGYITGNEARSTQRIRRLVSQLDNGSRCNIEFVPTRTTAVIAETRCIKIAVPVFGIAKDIDHPLRKGVDRTMDIEDGDHFWYRNGNISRAPNSPRDEWFPGSTRPTDYLDNGKEIYNYVVLPKVHGTGQWMGSPHRVLRTGRVLGDMLATSSPIPTTTTGTTRRAVPTSVQVMDGW